MALACPLLIPQVECTLAEAAVTAGEPVMFTVVISVQPLESVTDNVYVFAVTPEIPFVVLPLLQV